MRPIAPIDLYFLILIAVIRVLSWFPFRPVRMAVARLLTGLAWHLSRSKKSEIKRAIVLAFGGRLSEQELARIARESMFNSWLEIIGSMPNGIDVAATRDARVIGWEHLERALAAGKGVILWENGSFGRRFWAKQVLFHKGVLVHQIHGAKHLGNLDTHRTRTTWVRQNVIHRILDDAEKPYLAELIILPSGGDLAYGRRLLRELGKNAVVCLAADGTAGARLLAVPFLGTEHPFSSGMVSLARLSGAVILPIVCLEMDDGRACLTIEQAIRLGEDDQRSSQTGQIVLQYARLMEGHIRRQPGAYRNWHVSAWRHHRSLGHPERPQ